MATGAGTGRAAMDAPCTAAARTAASAWALAPEPGSQAARTRISRPILPTFLICPRRIAPVPPAVRAANCARPTGRNPQRLEPTAAGVFSTDVEAAPARSRPAAYSRYSYGWPGGRAGQCRNCYNCNATGSKIHGAKQKGGNLAAPPFTHFALAADQAASNSSSSAVMTGPESRPLALVSRSTSSITAIGAASEARNPALMMRV